jgi:hypothetical protein
MRNKLVHTLNPKSSTRLGFQIFLGLIVSKNLPFWQIFPLFSKFFTQQKFLGLIALENLPFSNVFSQQIF